MLTKLGETPKPYIPEKLPLKNTSFFCCKEFIQLLSKANNAIGAYNGFLSNTPNPLLLISPLLTQEAVLSSKLEGTHATFEDLLNHDAGNPVDIEKDELDEIINYRSALFYALKNIGTISDETKDKLPMSTRIIKEMHRILLDNVRGNSKRPGEFKVFQNYIGSSASVSFTPLPPELTNEYMTNLENYIHAEEIDVIVQAAFIHGQFEMIHPFEDGNGRIGRLLIPLFFYYRDILPYPTFYMSSFFEKDRSLYLEKLSNISEKNDWYGWICYFLKGVIEQASINTKKARDILLLYNRLCEISKKEIKSPYIIDVIDFIFEKPIFNATQMTNNCVPTKKTIYNILDKMVENNLIKALPGQRNKTYYCDDLLNIINW